MPVFTNEDLTVARLNAEGSSDFVNKSTQNSEISSIINNLNAYMEEGVGGFQEGTDEYNKMVQNLTGAYNQMDSIFSAILGKTNDYFNQPIQLSYIAGMPPQFNDMADPRLKNVNGDLRGTIAFGDGIGRIFKQYIVNDIPLILFKPGVPQFMPNVNIFDRTKITKEVKQKLLDQDEDYSFAGNVTEMSLQEILSGYDKYNDSRYYAHKAAFNEYTNYVNTMCRHTATKMGLNKYRNFNLTDPNEGLGTNFILRNSIGFFANKSGTSQSDSASNNTSESALGSAMKTLGSVKKECDFIFGTGAAKNRTAADEEKYQKEVSNLMGTVTKDPTSFLSRIGVTAKTIATGGNLLFPEIWSDSQYRKSYNIAFNFFSPYGDKESIFRNVYVPFYCILAMALPRQITTQGYQAPFLVKVSSKGWFNCDLGIIDSISFQKGENDGWTQDGLPLSITVNVSISDLYPTLMMSTDKYTRILSNNTGLIEFMDSMAGVGFNDYNPMRQLQLWLDAKWNLIGDIPESIQNKLANTIDGVASKMNNLFFR